MSVSKFTLKVPTAKKLAKNKIPLERLVKTDGWKGSFPAPKPDIGISCWMEESNVFVVFDNGFMAHKITMTQVLAKELINILTALLYSEKEGCKG